MYAALRHRRNKLEISIKKTDLLIKWSFLYRGGVKFTDLQEEEGEKSFKSLP